MPFSLDAALLASVIIEFVLEARQDARRLQSKNNLKQLGLAFHNYHDVYKQFPIGAYVRPDGTAIHGWIIRLVPYLESSPLVFADQPEISVGSSGEQPPVQVQVPNVTQPQSSGSVHIRRF